MHIRQLDSNLIEVSAPAKINLFLEVHGKADDGFHNLETVMCQVGIYDTIYFQTLPQLPEHVSFEVKHVFAGKEERALVPSDDRNLLMQSVHRLRAQYDVAAGARVQLVKRIPTQAGLGGGSSDAAAGLAAANLGWNLGLSHATLVEVAADLGSDVPFFLFPSPAVCRGRGEQVSPFPKEMVPRHFLIVQPPQGLSTAKVFERLAGRLSSPRRLPSQPGLTWMFNRLQRPAMELCESLVRVERSLRELGLRHRMLTGSGSAFFAVCRSRREAMRAANRLRQFGWARAFVTQSVICAESI